MAPGLAELYSAAIKQVLKREGRGGQTALAERLGVAKAYLNNLLAGRTGWPDAMKERVASIYGYSVAELLMLGEQYLNTGVWFPHARAVLHLAPKSMDRMEAIFRAAADDLSVGLAHVLFSRGTLPVMFPTICEDYSTGRISDTDVYDSAIGLLSKICPPRKSSI